MQIKIDFRLNSSFGVVERIIFRLVLNGFTDVKEIVSSLPVFSDVVIANAIKHLVNRQLLKADFTQGKLSISEPIKAIIDTCVSATFSAEIPENMKEEFKKDGVIIGNFRNIESNRLKLAVLNELLPGVNLDLYVSSLDFIMVEAKEKDE